MKKNTYPVPSATLVAFGKETGLRWGTEHIYTLPLVRMELDGLSSGLRDAVVRSLGFVAQDEDTDVEVVVLTSSMDF